MKACGIVVEYNPFHNGHQYHAQMARKLSGADVVIAVMSGNFLQRGEPAVMDKWSRTAVALEAGVDLVFELPLAWSVQSADYFAAGSIEILQACGCQALCFGTDLKSQFDYGAFGDFVREHRQEIDETYQAHGDAGKSYPERMRQVLESLYPPLQLKAEVPNHILALSYAQENAKYPRPMTLIPLARQQAGYHDRQLAAEQIASATAIREGFRRGADITPFLPPKSLAAMNEGAVDWEVFWPLLRYQILSSTPQALSEIYQMVEGLEYRFLAAVKTATSFKDFVEQVKSKRYTWTRIQRLCCYVLLQIQPAEIKAQWQQNYLHLLGFTAAGNRYLQAHKKAFQLPLYAKFGREEAKLFPTSFRADEIYRLADHQIPEQNFGKIPVMNRNPAFADKVLHKEP